MLVCVDSDVICKNKKGDEKRSLMTRYFVSSLEANAIKFLNKCICS
jgi:hypothetical protein